MYSLSQWPHTLIKMYLKYFLMNAPWYTVVILLMVIVFIAWNCNIGNLKCSGYHEATLKAAY